MAGRFITFVRRSIYSRWFYGLVAFVCLLNVGAELLDISTAGGQNLAVDLVLLVASSVTALLTATVFLDLLLRRTKP
jgi:hypothetical protein